MTIGHYNIHIVVRTLSNKTIRYILIVYIFIIFIIAVTSLFYNILHKWLIMTLYLTKIFFFLKLAMSVQTLILT